MALSLRGPVIRGGVPSGSQNAAQLVNLTNSFRSARANAWRPDQISNANIAARADEMATKFYAEGAMHEAGLGQLGAMSRLKQQLDASDELNNRMQTEQKTANIFGSLGKVAAGALMGGPMAPVTMAMGGLELAGSFF